MAAPATMPPAPEANSEPTAPSDAPTTRAIVGMGRGVVEDGAGENDQDPVEADETSQAGGPSVDENTVGGDPTGQDQQTASTRGKGLRAPCILIVISAMFVLAIYWTAENWSQAESQETSKWSERKCRVVGKSVNKTVTAQWRSEFLVDGFTMLAEPLPEQSPLTAFRYGSGVYNHTEGDALIFNSKFSVNQSYPCWVLPRYSEGQSSVRQGNASMDGVSTPMYSISMSPVRTIISDSTDIALVSTCVAIVLLASFMVALLYAISSADLYEGIDPAITPPDTGTIVPNALSEAQITRICAVAADTALRDPETEGLLECGWDCAICLDGEGSSGKLAQLNCKHTFHVACVRSWLLRGGVTCPLCNFRLRPIDEAAYAKNQAQFESDRTETDVLAEGEESILPPLPDIALALMGLATPPEPIYRAPLKSRTASTSSATSSSGDRIHLKSPNEHVSKFSQSADQAIALTCNPGLDSPATIEESSSPSVPLPAIPEDVRTSQQDSSSELNKASDEAPPDVSPAVERSPDISRTENECMGSDPEEESESKLGSILDADAIASTSSQVDSGHDPIYDFDWAKKDQERRQKSRPHPDPY